MVTLEEIKGNLQPSVFHYLENYYPLEQNKINDEDAENALIYGIQCYRIKFGKFYSSEICLSFLENNKLQFYNKDKLKIKNVSIDLIDNINIRHMDKIGELYNFDTKYNYICEFLIKKMDYYFFFKERTTVLLFVKGLLNLSKKIFENLNTHVDISVDRFNTNFNDELEDEELEYFASQVGIDIYKLKYRIDTNKDNTITLQEFKEYLKKEVSGEQFRPIFEKYATLLYNGNERVMGPIDLQNFFKEYQKEEISYLEACQIIIEFNSVRNNLMKVDCIKSFEELLSSGKAFNNKDIESILNYHNQNAKAKSSHPESLRLYMTLYEFNMMLHSLLNTVYDTNKLNQKLDIDHPLTDYFISSSHNTYLTGHQLVGKSSTKMYSTSLLYNFRMVELDCYEGESNQIVITHGYTLVDELTLDDVLIELKDTAFINSDLPVILSIENHLGQEYQEIMVERLQTILKDLYIFPSDIKPDHLPNLRDLKKKFLIKCGRSKLWENDIITAKKHVNQVYNLSNSFSLSQIINPSTQLITKKLIFLNKRPRNKLRHSTTVAPNLKRTKNLVVNKKRGEEKAIRGLERILGLIGVKFNKDKVDSNYYKPWEMITIKSTKATKFSEDIVDKKNIINLTQHCLLRIYPENFDSSNYNIIKCFACGIQGCCLNIQSTKDDFNLYNKIFFKQNERLGYVLKPEKFLSKDFDCYYDRASYICKIQFVSLLNLSKLIEDLKMTINNDIDLSLSAYAIGIKEDESNPKYNFKLFNGSLFPKFKDENPTAEFKVYEYDLSAVMIKIFLDDKLIGRGCIPYSFMKQGYRRIPIYDNQCFNMKDVYMLGHITLEKYQ